jgi:hypothetical protein
MLRILLSAWLYLAANAFQPSNLLFTPSFKVHKTTPFQVHASVRPKLITNVEMVPMPPRQDKKPFRRRSRMDANKLDWLQQATDRFVTKTVAGSLIDGKWHEVVSLLNAWSAFQKDNGEAPIRMEALLGVLINERNAGNANVLITIDMYNKLVDAWACAAMFNTVPNPIAASQRVLEIIVTLQENFEKTMWVSDSFQQRLILSNNNATLRPPLFPLRPNAESFHVALHVVCKIEGVLVARRLLAWMEHLYRSGKNVDAKPSRSHYMQILDAYARLDSSQSSILAEAFLRHLKYQHLTDEQLPDTLCYNIVIKSWSRQQRGREAAEHADRILEEMKDAASEHCRPDIVTYGCKCEGTMVLVYDDCFLTRLTHFLYSTIFYF